MTAKIETLNVNYFHKNIFTFVRETVEMKLHAAQCK